MNGSPVLSLVGGTKTYSTGHVLFSKVNAHRAFGPVDLTLREGECVAVVGRSGAGKSTLGRCLSGLEPLSEGTLLFGADARDVTRRGPGPSVQLLFQDSPTAMNPAWTVSAILTEALALTGSNPSKERIHGLLRQVGLAEELLGRLPEQLSGGQRRRLSIARALAVPSLRVLILDEPFAGLDFSSAEAITELLSKLRQEKNVALLLITHDLGCAVRLADRLLVMAQGKFVDELQSKELQSKELKSKELKSNDFQLAAVHEETRALIDAILPGVLQ